jgi:hypothetical protein
MLRWAGHAFAVFCTLVVIAALVGWAATRSVGRRWAWYGYEKQCGWTISRGEVSVWWGVHEPGDWLWEHDGGWKYMEWRPAPDLYAGLARDNGATGVLGFLVGRQEAGQTRSTLVLVPLWAPCAAGAVWPVVWWLHVAHARVAGRRRATGLCVACGYDLRAGHSRCPECGRQT